MRTDGSLLPGRPGSAPGSAQQRSCPSAWRPRLPGHRGLARGQLLTQVKISTARGMYCRAPPRMQGHPPNTDGLCLKSARCSQRTARAGELSSEVTAAKTESGVGTGQPEGSRVPGARSGGWARGREAPKQRMDGGMITTRCIICRPLF